MIRYVPGNPWHLDLDSARLPGGHEKGFVPIDDLVRDLEAIGVQVPGADKWHELLAAIDAFPVEPPAPSLDSTADDVRDYLARLVGYRVAPTKEVRATARRALNGSMSSALYENADELIMQLRPGFDAAAAALKKAKALGLRADDDNRSMRHASKEVAEAWDGLQGAARTLDQVLSIRQRLSLWVGVAPNLDMQNKEYRDHYLNYGGVSGIDWSVTVLKPGETLSQREPHKPWVRWLAVADRLYLATVAELTPEALLRAYGHNVEKLQAAARRRLEELEAAEQAG